MNTKYRILAADKLAPEGLDYIRRQPDADLVDRPGLSEDELAAIAGDHDGMIVRSGVQVTARVLARPGRLQAIVRAGVGVDNIDLEAATAAGILVMNSAAASTISTAEHAFALLLALARQIGPAYRTMADGGWDRGRFKGRQLYGKTLAVVGLGRIGQAVAERALAFGMKVVAHDPFVNADTMMDGKVRMYREFEEMLPQVDMITFHVPLNDQTRGMLGAAQFAGCVKPGVLVVNAARGGIVDERALLEALDAGACGGAALDVFSKEPPAAESEPGMPHGLRDHPRLLVTPHLGASTFEAQEAVSVAAASALFDYLRGAGVQGAVNVVGLRLDLDPLQERFVDLAQRIGTLVSPMATEGINAVTLEVCGSALVSAATTIERLALIGLLQPHLDTRLNVVNVHHIAEQRGIGLRTVMAEEERLTGPQIALEVRSGGGAQRIVGRVYTDRRPRVVEINGYHMDMVPAGNMILIRNNDKPGIIGMVGTEFGTADINIADMAISRRGNSALMLLRIDAAPPEDLARRLAERPGILKVATVKLPEEPTE